MALNKTAIISFVIKGLKNEEIGRALNWEGIALRAEHRGAQPTLRRLRVETSVRASPALYNPYTNVEAPTTALYHSFPRFN